MARDLAEARRLFAEMGVTDWDEYAKSIEGLGCWGVGLLGRKAS